jgi:DNA-binding SARP family transcriptional activator/Tfp pilus assembly protein PilF
MQVRLLGPVDVTVGGSARDIPGLRRKAVLAALALTPGQVVSTDRLVDIVWGPGATARVNTLQSHISYLRRVFGDPAAIVARPPGYQLNLDGDATDLAVAERLISQGRQGPDHASAAAAYRAALALWRGQPLAGVADLGWFGEQAQRLEELRLTAAEGLAQARLGLGEHAGVIPDLEDLVRRHPFQERLHAHLMLALYRAGRQQDALAAFQRLREVLDSELGIRPSASLRELHTAILRQDPQLELTAPPIALTPPLGLPVPTQLPVPIAAFAGRAGELGRLDDLAASERGAAPPNVIISVVSGTAGVGKTALAVRWAHQAAELFPDGQLYANLRGYDPAHAPLEPGTVLHGFLDALGVPAQRIPAGTDAQAALYRSMLTGKRVLVLLDNARDADQVRPLLPASAGCLAIVTSRSQLTSLVATHGARSLPLGLLAPHEARELLTRRLGAGPVAADQAAAAEIIARCAGLPLALAIVAARAETNIALPLSAVAEELRDSVAALDTLTAGDASTDLRAVFSWSTAALSQEAAELFRLLGLHPGPDLTIAAAASLAGQPAAQVRPLLGELVRAHLLTEHMPARFTFHDLLRAYAAEQARAQGTSRDRREAAHRMFDHYLHAAQQAARLLYRPWDDLVLADPRPGVVLERFVDESGATAWLRAEYQVLLGGIECAASTGFERHAWQLARTMASYFARSGHWPEWARVQRMTVEAAQRIADAEGEAHARHQLGNALTHLGDYKQAQPELRRALSLFRDLGDDTHRAMVHLCTGFLADCQGADAEALWHSQQALDLYRSAGNQAGEAIALNNIGWSTARLGRHSAALSLCRQSLQLHQQAHDLQGQAGAWDSLGYIHHRRADHAGAIECYTRAAEFYRKIRDRYNEAETLTRLGDAQHAAGDDRSAEQAWQQALSLHQVLGLGHPDATSLGDRLGQPAQERPAAGTSG